MKKTFKLIFTLTLIALISSCVKIMENAQDVPVIGKIEVAYKVNATTAFQEKGGTVVPDPNFPTGGLTVNFLNLGTNAITTVTTDNDGIASAHIAPGDYSIIVTGSIKNGDDTYMMNATVPSVSLISPVSKEEAAADGSDKQVVIRPAKLGTLVISEMYYNGSTQPYYFRDQTYHIYNNGDKTEYLDGLCFAQMYPNIVSVDTPLPTWPDEDGINNYVYARLVWKFPGNGTDYPLEPGEAVVLAQEARNHFTNLSDSNDITIDNSSANWECWFGNASRDNPDVPNLPHIFYCDMNYGFQWLASVYGPALCIFRPDDGTVITDNFYEKPAKNPNCQVQEGDVDMVYFARIPANWIIDGIECMEDLSLLGLKRIPGFVDAGAATAGTIYQAKVVSRKVVDRRADGTPIYADTNNSTNDFETLSGPVIRRYGQKAPAWDGTNNN